MHTRSKACLEGRAEGGSHYFLFSDGQIADFDEGARGCLILLRPSGPTEEQGTTKLASDVPSVLFKQVMPL
jgi:hypothetical protein